MATASCTKLAPPLVSEPDVTGTIPAVESWFFRFKGLTDRLLALLLVLPMLPVIGLVVLFVRLTSKGPGIYRQTRVGKGGRIFTMYKIRSMRTDAEGKTGPTWAGVVHDPRITPLGYWLRRLHLDELPQIFNVLRGEMSFVGPRPERPEFVSLLADQIPGYVDRLSIAPGVTGLAQVNLPPDTDLDSVRRKLVLDTEYIRTAGFLLDLRLVLCTALRLVGLRGGRSVWLLQLERTVKLPPTVGSVVNGQEAGGPTSIHEVLTPANEASSPLHRRQDQISPLPGNRQIGQRAHGLVDTQVLRETVTISAESGIELDDDFPAAAESNGHRRVKAK